MEILKTILYTFWRAIKTIFFAACYYVILILSGIVLYPQGSLFDMTRGEKLGLSLNIAMIAVFMVVSTIVIAYRLLRKKTWYTPLCVAYSYMVFGVIHFIFIYFMSKSLQVEFFLHIILFSVFLLIALILGLLRIKKYDCVSDDIDDEDLMIVDKN